MIWIRDEFGNLYQVLCVTMGDGPKDSGLIQVNDRPASEAYSMSVIIEILTDIGVKIRDGVRFLDLEEIIREVQEDMGTPRVTTRIAVA
jgi:hypothetical protein